MTDAAKYSAVEQLRNGRQIEIRALKPTDEEAMLAAIDRTGAQSLYRRFFGAKKHFSEGEKAFFLNVDFMNHVALVAEPRRTVGVPLSAADATSSSARGRLNWPSL
jgi:hypothetical protein